MISFASEHMIDELKALWMVGFPEDTHYCTFFFEHYFSCDKCVVSTNEQGQVVSAMYIFPGKTRIEGREHEVMFLYGASTHKAYRGRGIISDMCRFAADHCRRAGIPLISLSTSAMSHSLCEKAGLVPRVNMGATTIMVEGGKDVPPCEKCRYEEFSAMRKAYMSREFEIYWPEDTLRYMYAEMATSGDIVKTVIEGRTYYAAYTRMEDELLIRETNCPPSQMQTLVDGVCASLQYRGQVTIYTKADTVLDLENTVSQETFCYAHIWFLDERLDVPGANWYINLTAE